MVDTVGRSIWETQWGWGSSVWETQWGSCLLKTQWDWGSRVWETQSGGGVVYWRHIGVRGVEYGGHSGVVV